MERIFSISEVTLSTGINESTLRNWEREFSDYLAVSRDTQGARIYTQQDMEQFKMIQRLRKKGLSIGAIKDLLLSVQNGESLSNDEPLRVVTARMIPQNEDQIKVLTALEGLQTTLQQLPEQIRDRVKQELQIHQEQVTERIDDIIGTRLEKFRTHKKSWWKFWFY